MIAALLLVLACAFAGNWRFLDHDFRATDTLALIESGRLESPADVGRIFSEELLSGTSFAAGPYYRPIPVLSYGADHAVWGLHAFGYNLTNTMLHILVAGATFVLTAGVRAGLPGDRTDGSDLGSPRRAWAAGMLPAAALVLAVWSKESAIAGVPPMLALIWFRVGAGQPRGARLRLAAWRAAPLVLALLLALVVRVVVVGGGNEMASAGDVFRQLWTTTDTTFILLLAPQTSIIP
jgi:hypothetical protein